MPGDRAYLHTLTSTGTLVDAVLRGCDPDARPGTYDVGDAAAVALGAALGRAARRARARPAPSRTPRLVSGRAPATAG